MKEKMLLESFINNFSSEIEAGNAAIFAGAGLSASAGHVNWKNLLKSIATELGLCVDKEEHNLVNIAQYHINSQGNNRQRLIQEIINKLPQKSPSENHKILARLPINTYWTTNYDKLIENALEDNKKIIDVKFRVDNLSYTKPKRDTIVYKMHGDIDDPNNMIITKDDYERYPFKNPLFVTALSGDLVSKTFLFLGFSFTDPNLDYILSRVRLNTERNQRAHYCIFKRCTRDAFESNDDFEYAKNKQELAINDLKRFNIQTILISDYNEVTNILRKLEDNFRRKTIFISGSAHIYSEESESESESESAEEFIQKMSQSFISNDYRVVSGFGLGVGSHVINGALKEIYQKQGLTLHDQLILRPFPQGKEFEQQWGSYREDMISYAGVAIFIFGNKLEQDKVVLADGMHKEFNIAKKNGLKLIPIGATGFMAKQLWEEIQGNFDEYYPESGDELKSLFLSLGDTTLGLSDHLEVVIKIIGKLQGIN